MSDDEPLPWGLEFNVAENGYVAACYLCDFRGVPSFDPQYANWELAAHLVDPGASCAQQRDEWHRRDDELQRLRRDGRTADHLGRTDRGDSDQRPEGTR